MTWTVVPDYKQVPALPTQAAKTALQKQMRGWARQARLMQKTYRTGTWQMATGQ